MKRGCCVLLAAVMALSMTACGNMENAKKEKLSPNNPVTVTVWNYYNGDQLTAFENLVEEFNSTIGIDKGIVVVSVSQSDINTLSDELLNSIEGKAGAQEVPTLAAVYAETAYILNEEGVLSPMDAYFTEEELSAYVPGFIEEGRFDAENQLMLFPILKSTELFSANETDWAVFAADTGITLESIQTKEDLVAAAESYYIWTDEQTPDVPEDGKALYGRDSVANYIYAGCYQLGQDMFPVENGQVEVNLNRDAFKKLWDNYYIPTINGYFGSYEKFRSEDAKLGKILALSSSSSSAGYLPSAVTLEDDTTRDVTIYTAQELQFADAVVETTVQQGASYCMLKSTGAVQEGAAEFLKWFADPAQNMKFAVESSYSPVTIEANDVEAIQKAYAEDSDIVQNPNVLNALLTSAEAFSNKTAYATKPFKGSKDIRTLLGDALENIAKEDRAAVVAAIESGATREEAVKEYSTDAYFDAWFTDICDQVAVLMES